jgi:hypothetical protein
VTIRDDRRTADYVRFYDKGPDTDPRAQHCARVCANAPSGEKLDSPANAAENTWKPEVRWWRATCTTRRTTAVAPTRNPGSKVMTSTSQCLDSIDSCHLAHVAGGACAPTPKARIQAAINSVDFGVGSPQNKAAFACLKPAELRQLGRLQPVGGNPFDPR